MINRLLLKKGKQDFNKIFKSCTVYLNGKMVYNQGKIMDRKWYYRKLLWLLNRYLLKMNQFSIYRQSELFTSYEIERSF